MQHRLEEGDFLEICEQSKFTFETSGGAAAGVDNVKNFKRQRRSTLRPVLKCLPLKNSILLALNFLSRKD